MYEHPYLDDGVSSAIPLEERPGGKRLVDDALSGKFNAVIVYKLDRLERTARRILNWEHDYGNMGVTLVSVKEQLPPNGPMRALALSMLAGIAEYEKATIFERTSSGKMRTLRQGEWPGGPTPFGYRVVDGRLQINEEEAVLVREMYQLSLEGMSDYKIAERFNLRGTPSCEAMRGRLDQPKYVNRKSSTGPASGKWQMGTINGYLKDPIYKGEFVYGKRGKGIMVKLVVDVPAIVTADLWERVKVARSARQYSGRHPQRAALLKGKMRCAKCGCLCRPRTCKTEYKLYYYYGCTYSGRGRFEGKGCGTPHIRAEWAEEKVWAEIEQYLQQPNLVLEKVLANMDQLRDSLDSIKQELADLDGLMANEAVERKRLATAYRKGLLDDGLFDEQMAELHNEQGKYKTRQRELLALMEQADDNLDRQRAVEEFLNGVRQRIEEDGLTWEVKQDCVEHLVRGITLSGDEVDGSLVPVLDVTYAFGELPLAHSR